MGCRNPCSIPYPYFFYSDRTLHAADGLVMYGQCREGPPCSPRGDGGLDCVSFMIGLFVDRSRPFP